MQTEVPAQAIIAVATVVAALIAGLISFVNLTLNKEQKTSEFRQAWIDGLRENLAQFLSSMRRVARAEEAYYDNGPAHALLKFSTPPEQVSAERHAAIEALYTIRLRLNPDETEHIELLRLLDQVVNEQRKIDETHPSSKETVAAIDRVVNYARPVLKTEWKRVKSGELPFRVARNWIMPILVLLCLGFIAFLLAGKFKI